MKDNQKRQQGQHYGLFIEALFKQNPVQAPGLAQDHVLMTCLTSLTADIMKNWVNERNKHETP